MNARQRRKAKRARWRGKPVDMKKVWDRQWQGLLKMIHGAQERQLKRLSESKPVED